MDFHIDNCVKRYKELSAERVLGCGEEVSKWK